MKTLIEFLKSTLIGGFFILLPLLLFGVLLNEILDAVIGLSTPIADLFPKDTFENLQAPLVVAITLILLASVLLGLAARLPIGQQLGNWLENNTIGRLLLYRTIKSLTTRFAAIEKSGRFEPALIRGPNGQREFAFLMEDLGDGFVTVMIPRAPTPMMGTLKIVSLAQVEVLDVSLSEFTAVISHWGVGAKQLMTKKVGDLS